MERLTFKAGGVNAFRSSGLCTYGGIQNDGSVTYIGGIADKLAEYEDFEEMFCSKMTDAICDLLKDKKEFERWLERNKWIAKKCDEYARAEEQGKLLKPPCTVGDMTYNASRLSGRVIDAIVERIEIDEGGSWVITSSGTHSFDDFGKTVFLTREEAEAALKELQTSKQQ